MVAIDISTRISPVFQKAEVVTVNGKDVGYMWLPEDDNEWRVSINVRNAPEGVGEFTMVGTKEEVLGEISHRMEKYIA
jgi:hypothetical protein